MAAKEANPRARVIVRPAYRVERITGAIDAREPFVLLDVTAVVVLDGRLTVTIGDERHELGPGMMAVAPPATIGGSGQSSNCDVLGVVLKDSVIAESARRLELHQRGHVVVREAVEPLDGGLDLSARRLALSIDEGGGSRQAMLDLAVDAFATDLVDRFGRVDLSDRLERSRAGLVDRRLRRSIEFMADNFDRDIPLGEIAAAAFLSEFHFARLFKRVTGQTPHAFLASMRIDHARTLLAESDLSIAEVAARVGYQSASHFGKVFRQATGITPTTYRDAALR